jgi:hypothetical protein
MTSHSYLHVFQADKSSATKVIMSISHPGLVKNISEQAFGKSIEAVSAAGAGLYLLSNMFRE